MFPVTIDRDLGVPVNDGDLDKRFRVRRLDRKRGLIFFRARPEVTPRHPLAGSKLAKHDAVEMRQTSVERQGAATALREVRGGDSGDECLVSDRLRVQRDQGSQEQGGEEWTADCHVDWVNPFMLFHRRFPSHAIDADQGISGLRIFPVVGNHQVVLPLG